MDERLDRYIRYISSVQEERISFNEAVNHSYYNFKSIEQLIEELPDLLASSMNNLLDNAVETLTSNGVYEYDKARFMQKYSAQLDTTNIISPLVERYLQVMDYQGEVENYHNYIRECRKRHGAEEVFLLAVLLRAYKGAVNERWKCIHSCTT